MPPWISSKVSEAREEDVDGVDDPLPCTGPVEENFVIKYDPVTNELKAEKVSEYEDIMQRVVQTTTSCQVRQFVLMDYHEVEGAKTLTRSIHSFSSTRTTLARTSLTASRVEYTAK
jgi:hypothetical protein